MNHYYSYLNSAKEVIASYNGNEPLSAYLKTFFSRSRKYGSKDRKQISHLCYCFYRLGKMAVDLDAEERILLGLFLCSSAPNEILQHLKPEWNRQVGLSVEEKLSASPVSCTLAAVFPWKEKLGEGIDCDEFYRSFFIQPDLFLRLRPGQEAAVKEKLSKAGIAFIDRGASCISLPNASKVDDILRLDEEAVIQDLNSQRTGDLMRLAASRLAKPLSAWDCCAASGGKSILLYDLDPAVKLTVTDIRPSSLSNLRSRFARAGITAYTGYAVDVSKEAPGNTTGEFDLVIADVPCSGSGTWSRTPEQLYFFNETRIPEFKELQQKIIDRIVRSLKNGGYLLYITCSVFKMENEDVVEYVQRQHGLQLISKQYLRGFDQKADSLFAGLLYRPL